MAYSVCAVACLSLSLFLCALNNGVSATKKAEPVNSRDQFFPPDSTRSCSLVARFDMSGIRGTITFYQRNAQQPFVEIHADLMGLDQTTNATYPWHIHDYPIVAGLLPNQACMTVGGHYDPLNRASSPSYEADCRNRKELCEVGDLAGKFQRFQFNQQRYRFEDRYFSLYSSFNPVGRSIVIHEANGDRFACANIEYDGNDLVETYRAPFTGPVLQGDIVLKRQVGKSGVTLYGEVYRVDGGPIEGDLCWNLRRGEPNADGTCGSLGNVYGTGTFPSDRFMSCSNVNQRSCFIGNLTGKCGNFQFGNPSRMAKFFCNDDQLGVVPPTSYLSQSITVEQCNGEILGCSKFSILHPQRAMVDFRTQRGARVFGTFYQTDPFEQTYARVFLNGLQGMASYLQIKQIPLSQANGCSNTGPVFEPRSTFTAPSPRPRIVTGDFLPVGELRYKWTNLTGLHSLFTTERSSYLPMFGPYSIVGHPLALHNADGVILGCADIQPQYRFPSLDQFSIMGLHRNP